MRPRSGQARRPVPLKWLAVLLLLAMGWAVTDRVPYAEQFRQSAGAGVSRAHPLGADEVGRDRLARLLYGSRISLLLAGGAALLSTAIAAVVGGAAGYLGGWYDAIVLRAIDLMLSVPWILLLVTVRALLPLNVSPVESVLVTFGVLGLLGWAGAARVVRTGASALRQSDAVIHARACGLRTARILTRHVIPRLAPVLRAQFWIALPVFVLSEANLGMLGLGVQEPLPSWGNLLRELQNPLATGMGAWAPLALLVLAMSALQFMMRTEDVRCL